MSELEDDLTPVETKRKAASGVVLLAGRSVVFRILGLLGNVVLARLLAPDEFGVVAIGLTIVTVGQFLADGSVGAALIVRREQPDHLELRAIGGFQLFVAMVVALLGLGVSVALGESGRITALMMLALPLVALRGPIMLLLQRRLDFRPQIRIEATEVITYLILSLLLAALGFGAWSLAIATVVRTAAGTSAAWALSPVGRVVPSIDIERLRPIFAFGIRMQGDGLVQLVQDAALIASIGAVSGFTGLGLWSLAQRILSVPFILFESAFAVAFPAFSRLAQAGQDVSGLLERGVATMAIMVAALMTPVLASAPASVPVLFGDAWREVSLVLPGATLVCVLNGPVNIVLLGFLYAMGDAKTPLRASIALAVVRIPVTLALLEPLGVAAIGIGWAAGALVHLPIILAATRRHTDVRLLRCTLAPCVATGIGGGAGWALAVHLGETVPSVVASAALGLTLCAAVLAVIAPRELRAARSTGRSAIGAIRGRAAPDPT